MRRAFIILCSCMLLFTGCATQKVQKQEDYQVVLNIADRLFQEGKFEEAILFYEETITREPLVLGAYLGLLIHTIKMEIVTQLYVCLKMHRKPFRKISKLLHC